MRSTRAAPLRPGWLSRALEGAQARWIRAVRDTYWDIAVRSSMASRGLNVKFDGSSGRRRYSAGQIPGAGVAADEDVSEGAWFRPIRQLEDKVADLDLTRA